MYVDIVGRDGGWNAGRMFDGSKDSNNEKIASASWNLLCGVGVDSLIKPVKKRELRGGFKFFIVWLMMTIIYWIIFHKLPSSRTTHTQSSFRTTLYYCTRVVPPISPPWDDCLIVHTYSSFPVIELSLHFSLVSLHWFHILGLDECFPLKLSICRDFTADIVHPW